MFYLLSLLITMQLSPKVSIGMHQSDFIRLFSDQNLLIINNGRLCLVEEKILEKEIEWMYSFEDEILKSVKMIYTEKELSESKFSECRKIYDKILENLIKSYGKPEIKEGNTNYIKTNENLTDYEVLRATWKNTDGSEIILKFRLIDSDAGFEYMIIVKMY